ncbi:unnamed protein product, partial [Brachionus calyciflorus]
MNYGIKSSNIKIKAGHISEIEFIILPRVDVLLGIDLFVANGASINPRKRQVWFESSVYTDSKTSEFDFSEDEMEVMLTDQLDEIEDIESDLDGWDFRPNEKELLATSLDDLKEPSNLPPFDIKTTIDTPIRLRPYRVSHHERAIIKEEVDKMLDAGIIQPSTCPWASPVCLTNKPDGSKRFCIDYRQINKITVQDPFPLPRIEAIIDILGVAMIFSLMDLKSGYWQILMAMGAIAITAFTTPDGHYEFLRLPFRLKNGPSFFSRTMDENGIEYVCAYASRPLKGGELHYGITEKECLAVVWSVKMFRIYLYGNIFILVTDHSALLWLMKIKDANGKLARWAICLQTYTFEKVHRAGKKHLNADALSRAFAVVEELDEELDTDRSIKELDPWEDGFLLHFLKTG